MKKVTEIQDWIIGATERLGDPSHAVGSIFVRLVPRPPSAPHDDIIAIWDSGVLGLVLAPGQIFPIDVDPDGPVIDEETRQLQSFGLEKICPGVWTLLPSLNVPGVIHVFVTIYDVPTPAPWESQIVVVSSLAAIGGGR